jgi:tRNA A37 threonylcarbamoyladenosine biosynthesis protein TsaE
MLGFDAIGTTAIGESSSITQTSSEIDAIVADLASGAESQRRVALHRIISGEFQDRTALADALIQELLKHNTQTGASDSSRPSNHDFHAAARSWLRSALIWCQPKDQRTKNIVEVGLNPDTERVAFVRFWTLAAVIGVRAPYVREFAAISTKDPSLDVSFLAWAVLHPGSPELRADMRAALNGRNLGEIYGILRALRVISVPEIVQDVAALLGFEPSVNIPPYDVFCALATPRMVTAAAHILSSNPGLDMVVGKMVLAADSIDSTTAQNFAQLLVKMDPIRSEALLREREAISELRTGARMLLNGLLKISTHGTETFRQLPGFAADTIDGQTDHLDIQAEVNTLTAIMMAKDVTPPLAIGLFGEWGAGKSFFMSRMKKTVKELIASPTQTGEGPFCANAVQIHFNAWHYADTNLWASLVSSIFEDLDGYLSKKDAKLEERDLLLVQLASAQAATEAARVEEEQVSERLKEEQARLAAAAAERENNISALSRLQAKDVADLLLSDKELKEKAEKALRELGLPAVMDGVGDLRRALTEAQSLLR